MTFKHNVEYVNNNEKMLLPKQDLSLSNSKIENWFMQQKEWLAVVPFKVSSELYVLL